MTPSLCVDDRAVSVTVTHVLTIAITTILIAGLLTAATGLLDSEQNRAGNREMRSVGETLATELVTVSETAQDQGAETARLETTQPDAVVGDGYKIRLRDSPAECANRDIYQACLTLSSSNGLSVDVPVNLPSPVQANESFISGGEIAIVYDDTGGGDPDITIEEA
jgi:FlaG/FlaF family flagellin (archaellin)